MRGSPSPVWRVHRPVTASVPSSLASNKKEGIYWSSSIKPPLHSRLETGIATENRLFFKNIKISQTLSCNTVLLFCVELTQLEVFRVVDGALDSHRHLSHPHPWPQNGSLQASVTSVTGSDVIRFPEVLLLALPGKLFSNWDHTSGRTEEFGNLSTRFCV